MFSSDTGERNSNAGEEEESVVSKTDVNEAFAPKGYSRVFGVSYYMKTKQRNILQSRSGLDVLLLRDKRRGKVN